MPNNAHIGLAFFAIASLLALSHSRDRWLPQLRAWLSKRRIRLDGCSHPPSFQRDIESGLISDNFDLVMNNFDDSRKGLNEEAKGKILKRMNANPGLSFDEARLRYTRKELSKNQIGPDGMPLDPKTVTFGR